MNEKRTTREIFSGFEKKKPHLENADFKNTFHKVRVAKVVAKRTPAPRDANNGYSCEKKKKKRKLNT
jgi:hypothetical protein